ncbi:MAG: hypothetical protein C0603_06825 [Denitrovibrio sp.]|nr:MAG: hypothetical protein C0603_06825 [Denitrovibrio sp.]
MGLACQVPKEYEMKKLFPVLIIMMMVTGCITTQAETVLLTPVKPALNVIKPVGKTVESAVSETVGFASDSLGIFLKASGFTYILLAAEMNANLSSLVIDKTKEKIVDYKSQVAKKLVPGSFFFVIPPKISNGETFVYDEEMGRMIRNYLTLAKYGVPVSNPADAEYIVVTNVRESLSKTYGLNYSEISLSIVDKLDIPTYAASIRVESKSDRNFWYYATKRAKPVTELTMKGMTHIMAEGMPDAHGDIAALVQYAKKLVGKEEEVN